MGAKKARGMLKDLAGILYKVVPHASAFKHRGNALPSILVQCAEPVTCLRPASEIPKEFTQEMVEDCYRKFDVVANNSAMQDGAFKLKKHIYAFQAALSNQKQKLVKHVVTTQTRQSEKGSGRSPKDRDSFPIWKGGPKPRMCASKDRMMGRLHTALSNLDFYEPLQIDDRCVSVRACIAQHAHTCARYIIYYSVCALRCGCGPAGRTRGRRHMLPGGTAQRAAASRGGTRSI